MSITDADRNAAVIEMMKGSPALSESSEESTEKNIENNTIEEKSSGSIRNIIGAICEGNVFQENTKAKRNDISLDERKKISDLATKNLNGLFRK